MFDFIVVGKGLIGAAAARHLSAGNADVALLGPDEPVSLKVHHGVFASHYDQARITRILDPDVVWATLAQRSIDRYGELEIGGEPFFNAVGCLKVGPEPESGSDYISANARTGAAFGLNYEILSSREIANRYPFFLIPAGFAGILEHRTAGLINPRAVLKNEVRIAEKQSARVVRETVCSVDPIDGGVAVKTLEGREFTARKVILAPGAFANCYGLLNRKISVSPTVETVLLARVPHERVHALRSMPVLIYQFGRKLDTGLSYVYLLPPVLYPDGSWYVKIGGDCEKGHVLRELHEFEAWFHSDGDPVAAEKLKDALLRVMPDLCAESFVAKPCVVTQSAHQRPYIDAVLDSRVYLAGACCGTAAKSADEIGRLAAELARTGSWSFESVLNGSDFRVVYQDESSVSPSRSVLF